MKNVPMLDPELKKQYNIISSFDFLSTEDDIVPYFEDVAYEYFECGQGFYEDTKDFIVYLQKPNQFYKVTVNVDIGSAKQDRGPRLYWVDGINKIVFTQIPKPQPKDTTKRTIAVEAYQYNKAIDALIKAGISIV